MKPKYVIAPLTREDYNALRDAVDLAISHLEERRIMQRHGLFGLLPSERGPGPGPLERRLKRLQKTNLAHVLEV